MLWNPKVRYRIHKSPHLSLSWASYQTVFNTTQQFTACQTTAPYIKLWRSYVSRIFVRTVLTSTFCTEPQTLTATPTQLRRPPSGIHLGNLSEGTSIQRTHQVRFAPDDGSRAGYRNAVFQLLMTAAEYSQISKKDASSWIVTATDSLTTTNHDHCILPLTVSERWPHVITGS